MSRIWANRSGTHLIHAGNEAEVEEICSHNGIAFRKEAELGNKPVEELLEQAISILASHITGGRIDTYRVAQLQRQAVALRDGEKSALVPDWRPLWEGEVVFLCDRGGKRAARTVKDLLSSPRGIIAVRQRTTGTRELLVDCHDSPGEKPDG
jgi:hypothetical protein